MDRLRKNTQDRSADAVRSRLLRILASGDSRQDTIHHALDVLLEASGSSGGLLVVQPPGDQGPALIVHSSPPHEWIPQIEVPDSPLRLVLDRVFSEGDLVEGPDFQLAAAVPLPSKTGFQGALLLAGEALEPRAYQSVLMAAFLIGKHLEQHTVEGPSPILTDTGPPTNRASTFETSQSIHLELLRSRNTLRALFDSIPSSIYIIDQDYKLVALNMSRADRAHVRPRSIVGQKCYEALFHRKEPCQRCQIKDTLTKGRSTMRYDRTRGPDRQVAEWEISTYPINGPTNEPSQAILVETDITERRGLEIALIQSEKLAALGQLAAGVAHEINNPLAAILANAQIAAQDLDPESDLYDAIKLIQMAGERASDVVASLLRLSRKEDYESIPLDLNETIQNAAMLMQHAIAARPVELHLDLEDDLPAFVGSKNNLQGLWINLIQNALDAFEETGGTIQIQTRRQEGSLLVRLSDNGKGIEPEYLSRIFEPFYTTKQIGRGTGLGLSLCHEIVKQHGGTIDVESQLGVGTEFQVILPLDSGERL